MKKILLVFLVLAFYLTGCAREVYPVDCGDNNCYKSKDNAANNITVNLAPDSLSGEIPPGDRTLAIFTAKSNEVTEIYGLDLDVVNNYNEPIDYCLVDEVWVEDIDGNVIFEPRDITEGYSFWGLFPVPAGESNFVVKGHVTFGEAPDVEWNPRPEFRVKVNGVYASADVSYANLQGNTLFPKYSGYTYVSAALSANAPGGQVFEGMTYEVYRFDLWTDQGTSYFSHPVFQYNQDFDGEPLKCSLWQGNTLLSDNSTYLEWKYSNGLSIWFNPEDEKPLLTPQPKTFSLWCQVETNNDNQDLQIRLLGAQYETGIEGNSIYIPNPTDWKSWTFIMRDQLYVSMATDTPQVIIPGVNVTLMKFKMMTSANEAKLYSLPFLFLNRPAGVYSNCHIEDDLNNTLNVDISGYDNGGNSIYETYFMGPRNGAYPGDAYNFTVVGTTWRTFELVCDVAPSSGTATTIQLQDVYYYQVGTAYYDVKPDTFPIVETWVIQL